MTEKTRDEWEAELLAIPDPIARAKAITAAQRTRRLTPRLKDQRKDDIAYGRRREGSANKVAGLVGLAKSGIHRLAPLQSTTEGATP